MNSRIYIFALLSIFALTACNSEDVIEKNDDELVPVALKLTRAESDGLPLGNRTYRVMLFDKDNHKFMQYGGNYLHGTYYDDDGTKAVSGVLKAAKVNANGQLIDAEGTVLTDPATQFTPSPSDGLIAPTGWYSMVLVTPAVMPKQTSAVLNNWGIYYPRYEKVTGSMYVSKYIDVYLRSRGDVLNPGTNKEKQYDTLQVNLDKTREVVLTEPRSRIRFTIACTKDVTESNVTAVRLSNLIDYAWYDPANGDFYIERGGVEYDMIPSPIVLSPSTVSETNPKVLHFGDDPWELPVKGSDIDEADGEGYIHVLSQDYSKRGSDNKTIYPIFKLEIERDDDIAILPLDYKMEPHYNYTFEVLIKTQAVHVNIIATPWDDGNGVNTTGGVTSSVDNPEAGSLQGVRVAPWVLKRISSDVE